MEWFFDRRGKSIANSAQKVVAEMHVQLEKKDARMRALERSVANLRRICTASVEKDLVRLEKRKRELIEELEKIDDQILDRQETLSTTMAEIAEVLKASKAEPLPAAKPVVGEELDALSDTFDLLEEQYIEEIEMLESLRELRPTLFMIHRNNSTDVVFYVPAEEEVDVVHALKISNSLEASTIAEMSTYELLMAFGKKIAPNEEREFPHVRELVVPAYFSPLEGNLPPPSSSTDRKDPMGVFVGAFEIPLAPGVVIDVWREDGAATDASSESKTSVSDMNNGNSSCEKTTEDPGRVLAKRRMAEKFGVKVVPIPPSRYWASTTVDGVAFAVLERMFVISTTNWGVTTVSQVDIFGRHPVKGNLLIESVTASGE